MPTRHKRRPKSYEELISCYYADDPVRRATRVRAYAQSLGHDDGEVLRRRGNDSYVVQATAAILVEEYIVGPAPVPTIGSPVDEVIDVPAPTAPPPERGPALPPATEPPVGTPAPTPPPAERMPAPSPPPAEPMPAPSPTPAEQMPALSPPAGTPAASAQSVEDAELAADMQAILSGEMVYDPASGRTVPRDQVGAAAPLPPQRPTDAPNEQAIFDRIAESMSYANKYDLGTVEVDNRFSDFDRFDDLAGKHRDAKRAGPEHGQPSAAEPKVTSKDFIEDLGALSLSADETDDPEVRDQMAAIGRAAAKAIYAVDQSCGPTAANAGIASSAREYAAPMYDAGEHALAGADQYKDALLVGQNPGVRFSYGELLAMGDLYEDASQMQNASVAELTKLKELIQRSTRFYAGKRAGNADDSLDVSHGEWDGATGKRYRRLADDNYEHFAPDVLFGTATTRNHKNAWEHYHRMAIEEAQRLALLPENQNVDYIPESALIINAFGDHFLTDAFAAGHLVNKAVLIDRFKQNFYTSPGKLNSAAGKFFERVANKAFTGEVKRRFEVLEERQTRCFKHWNIDTTNAFRKLLVGIAEQAPDAVSNIAAKTIHDYLNKTGIQVTNGAGHRPWHLTGDDHLTGETLDVMKEAVNQSIANINDSAILASNLNFGPFFERVWKYTPQLTPASRTEVQRLVGVYTDPNSTVLSDAAAELISRRSTLDMLIDELVEERRILQHE
jgi:hypothetical protein